MQKKSAIILILILLLAIAPTIIAEENTTTNETTEDTTETTTTTDNTDKTQQAFTCLESKTSGKCSSLTIEEISLTLLASPSQSIIDECAAALKSKKSNDHSWNQDIRDTALAILALNHVKQDTAASEQWLLNQNKTPTDLIWFLEQDSDGAVECKISYDGSDYRIKVDENKKIDSNAGSCLSRAMSNFLLQISSNCLNKEFLISCNKQFIAAKIFKNKNSPTLHPLPDTQSEPASGTANVKVNSKCFGTSGCDYEDSLWATYALLKTGHDVSAFFPYIIALSESNEKYLPAAPLYLITNHQEYAADLVATQETGNYWDPVASPYSKYYNTALAIMATGSSSAKDYLFFQQESDGCWKNSNNEIIRDTAIVLWALVGRTGTASGGGVTYCSEANHFCIPETDCPQDEVMENFFCSGISTICCQNEHLKSCDEHGGEICTSGEFCSDDEVEATEGACCLGTCEELTAKSVCEQMNYYCKTQCSDSQEEVDYDCDGTDVCCRTKTSEGGSLWWLWVLIILIILAILAIIFREKLKMFWFKIKSRGKGKGRPGQPPTRTGPGMPPKPGFPPIRRMPGPVPMPGRPPTRQPRKPIDNTFDKLKSMIDK